MSAAAEEADPLREFAAMMVGAKAEADGPPDPAPYGYTVDEKTGQTRPKKAPGRPRKSPSLEDLKTQREADPSPVPPSRDRPPAALKGRGGRRREKGRADRPAPPVPQSLRMEGSIAKGVNRIYRKIGKIVEVGDADVGGAIIASTRAIDADDITVGDAWEALCRSNPKVKAFWIKALSGGAWGEVLAAHMPIFGAVLMKDAIRNRLPFWRLAGAFVDDSDGEDEAPAAGTPFQGMSQEDLGQMVAFAQATAERMMGNGGPPRGE